MLKKERQKQSNRTGRQLGHELLLEAIARIENRRDVSDEYLNKQDLFRLTGFRRTSDREKWLKANNFPFDQTADSRVLLLRADVEKVLGATAK